MGLSTEERDTVVRLQMEKADRFLRQADKMFAEEEWDLAINRYYYACFHAVQGLFVYNGLTSRRHKGMIMQFGQHFVKTGIISSDLGSFLSRMERLRELGDYNCNYNITKVELEEFVEPAHQLVTLIGKLIAESLPSQ